MDQRFVIEEWAAYAPGLEDRAAWLDWLAKPEPPIGTSVPPLTELPAMQRRRLEGLGRMALQVAFWARPETAQGCALVFSSRHGDIHRTFAMLDDLAVSQPLSPTAFGLSTHNAIAAQFVIATGFTGNYAATAGGPCSPEAAVCEALGLLADGAERVLIVHYDVPPPESYSAYLDEAQASYAWAIRIAPAQAAGASFSLRLDADAEPDFGVPDAQAAPLPHGLEVLRFLLSGQQHARAVDGPRRWRWQRHA